MKKLLFTSILLCTIFLIQSCKKEPEAPIPQEHGAHISLMNVCNGSKEVNATIKNLTYTLFQRLNFLSISGYYVIAPDEYQITFTTVPTSKLLSTTKSTLEYEKYYLAMVIGQAGRARILVTENRTDNPQAGKARIRFINVSPDSCSVDVMGNSSTIFPMINYKEVTSYVEVNAGTFNVAAKRNSEGDVLTEDNFDLEEQRNYTLLLIGSKDGQDEEALKLKLIRY